MLKQASGAPAGTPGHKGIKILLPDGNMPLPVKPLGNRNWWSGNRVNMVSQMTLAASLTLPATPASTLSFNTAYNTERGYDYFRLQLSTGCRFQPATA